MTLQSIPLAADAADRILESIIDRSLAWGASDVHLVPESRQLRIRYRVDGRLCSSEESIRQREAEILTGRIKVLAGLNIAERRRPQEGSIRLPNVELRVSLMPCLEGESISIRVLHEKDPWRDLDELGLDVPTRQRLDRFVGAPAGVLVVVGPTGSGKTTTLYALCRQICRAGRRVISVEDPIERRLEGVVQVAIRPEEGFGFPEALRGVLRHDPDVLLVGEVRDPETAALVLSAGLSGHLVLASLHAGGPRSALARLIHFGVDRRHLAGILDGILTQRLVPAASGGRQGEFHLFELDAACRSSITSGEHSVLLEADLEVFTAAE